MRKRPLPTGPGTMRDPSHTWVCFSCRTAYRRAVRDYREKPVICAECGKECERLGYRRRIPKKTAKRAWGAFERYYLRPTKERWELFVKLCRRGA